MGHRFFKEEDYLTFYIRERSLLERTYVMSYHLARGLSGIIRRSAESSGVSDEPKATGGCVVDRVRGIHRAEGLSKLGAPDGEI